MSPGEQAEKLVADFGITSPDDLDVEAFAFDARLEVEYQELQGCEATLVGFENRAIATVRPSTVLGRQRFSIAHGRSPLPSGAAHPRTSSSEHPLPALRCAPTRNRIA